MLEVEGLTAGYGPIVVLRGIDLAIGDGEIVAMIGPNGAGKTTTFNACSGLLRLSLQGARRRPLCKKSLPSPNHAFP